ncbi:MAG TPA: glycosyltransferase [Chryseolinea sp.]|nr:glycosyltransferase [Chryseolinea sp.]
MGPFFSIVIPTYNRAAFVADAVKSVLSQTYTDFEIIVVDDGSQDNTEEVIRLLNDPRLIYCKKINEERSIAKNYGIGKASGTYINFLDSDDKFYPNHLEKGFELLAKNKFPEIGHLGYEIVKGNDVIARRNDLGENFHERILQDNILHGNAIFIRRDIALTHQFLNNRNAFISEDWHLWLCLISRYNIYFDNTVTSVVNDHAERSLKSIDPDKLTECIELIVADLKTDNAFKRKFGDKTAYFYADQYTFVALLLSLNKRKMKVLKYLAKAFKEDITVLIRKRFLASVKYFLFPFLVKSRY